MPTRILAAVFLCLTLSGCILESKVPIFADKDGDLLLTAYGSRFAAYSLDDGSWKKDQETISFTAKGRHYEVSDGNSAMDITFAKISGSWWAMQAVEAGKGATYVLVEAAKGELLLYPVACKPLREAGTFDDFIEFKDDDCFVKDGVNTTAMFKALAALPGTSSMKMVALP